MNFNRKDIFRINVLTLFPDAFPGTLNISICKRAREKKLWELNLIDVKKFAKKGRNIDSSPFGGGPGMVLRPDVLQNAYDSCTKNLSKEEKKNIAKIMLSPKGKRLDNKMAVKLSKFNGMVLISGRYEGVDERFIEYNSLEEISIGDYVVMGGEVAAMVLIETVLRNRPQILGNSESLKTESFVDNNLEYPQYTKPRIWKNMEVPAVLLSGNHGKIAKWRADRSKVVTKIKNKKKKQ